MTLHPILALNQIIEEYRDHLRIRFRAKDPALKEGLGTSWISRSSWRTGASDPASGGMRCRSIPGWRA